MPETTPDLSITRFWQGLRHGVAVAVADPTPDKLLGVRDGFRRFFHQRFDSALPVAVVGADAPSAPFGLPVTDRLAVSRALQGVRSLAEDLGETYHFFAASEGGIHLVEIDGENRYFVRNWTAVRGAPGEAVGGSGSVQLPDRLIAGLDRQQVPFAVPGTRRRGGMISSLTGGLENRRRSTALSTVHALSTLFYGMLETRAPGTGG